MKKLIAMTVIATSILTGCKTTPSTETLYSSSYAIGVSTALVMDQTKIPNETRNVIIEIMNKVEEAVPLTNSTFTVAWTPIAKEHTQNLVDDKKITEDEANLILSAFGTATQTLDYFIFKRYPKVGQNIELVEAATHGFCTGFLSYYKPVNIVSSKYETPIYDDEAYNYMLKTTKETKLLK